MVEFIFSLILMVCLGAMLYVAVRALPRIEEYGEEADTKNFIERWAHSEIPEKIDAAFGNFLVKFLRRAKVVVLRIDNSIAKSLRKVKPQEHHANTNIDFKELSGQNMEDKEGDSSLKE